MESERRCPQCGQLLAAGELHCPRCSGHAAPRSRVLGLSLLSLVVLFALTGFAARAYHLQRDALGQEWNGQGQLDLQAGKAEKAVVDFRTALVYARDSEPVQLNLARALVAANRHEEAKAYLTSLWERDPANAVVNLELGRLATSAGEEEEALRYYHNALYDDWGSQDPAQARRSVRLEIYQFLMKQGDRRQAQAELVAMAALLPPDPALYVQVGHLFLDVGDNARAVAEFQNALRLGGGEAALEGLGEAEFLLGNYRQARLHLGRALHQKPGDPRLAEMLDKADRVLDADPFQPNLTLQERDRRILRAYHQALLRLAACGVPPAVPEQGPAPGALPAPSSPQLNPSLVPLADGARSLQPRVSAEALDRDPDLVSQIMNLVFQIEEASVNGCPPPEALDQALLLLARQQASPEK